MAYDMRPGISSHRARVLACLFLSMLFRPPLFALSLSVCLSLSVSLSVPRARGAHSQQAERSPVPHKTR